MTRFTLLKQFGKCFYFSFLQDGLSWLQVSVLRLDAFFSRLLYAALLSYLTFVDLMSFSLFNLFYFNVNIVDF